MSSKWLEDLHTAKLDKLLDERGLVCERTVSSTPGESFSEEEAQEQERPQEEQVKAEESVKEEIEIAEEVAPASVELKEVFPTPSLRRMIPEKLRRIEEQNVTYVLPEEFRKNFNPGDIPRIKYTAPQRYIEILGELTGCQKYNSSLGEYWFLDTLAFVLQRAQEEAGFDKPAQAVLIYWYCQWMREMVYFDAADRERMMKRFQDNMFAAARFIGENSRLPTPLEAGVYHKPSDDDIERKKQKEVSQESKLDNPKSSVTFHSKLYECSMHDLVNILHYIYDLFSTDYQYDLIRSVFTKGPEYCLIDAPFQIQQPRTMFFIPKPGKVGKTKDKSPKPKDKSKKGKKEEPESPPTQEYLNLLELMAYDQEQQQKMETQMKEDYFRRTHILPLTFAATDELFDKYWPPPTPEPEPSPTEVVVTKSSTKKGKGKGKK